jgi:hypothetical protein
MIKIKIKNNPQPTTYNPLLGGITEVTFPLSTFWCRLRRVKLLALQQLRHPLSLRLHKYIASIHHRSRQIGYTIQYPRRHLTFGVFRLVGGGLFAGHSDSFVITNQDCRSLIQMRELRPSWV